MTTSASSIHEPDWDSDAHAPADGSLADGMAEEYAELGVFEERVAALGATIVGGQALHNARHGGSVRPGGQGREEEDAVYADGADPELAEVVTGFSLIDVDDEAVARRIAALVPTGGRVEWRRALPMA